MNEKSIGVLSTIEKWLNWLKTDQYYYDRVVTAVLNQGWHASSIAFVFICLYWIFAHPRASWRAKVFCLAGASKELLTSAHRLWWNIGIWTDTPGDGYPYGVWIQEHRTLLAPVIVGIAISLWIAVIAASRATGWRLAATAFAVAAFIFSSIAAAVYFVPHWPPGTAS